MCRTIRMSSRRTWERSKGMGKSTVLQVRDLDYKYGAIHALRGVSLEVGEGEIVALIGGNGAGKTTTLRCISGLLDRPESGDIRFYEESIIRQKSEKIAAKGVMQVLEGRHIFAKLSVKENLSLGAFNKKADYSSTLDYVYSLFPVLKEREHQEGGTLSGGEQQMLALGRALMSKPKLLMMDEPSLGLAPIIVKNIFEMIRQINRDGTTILLVEQNSKAALNIADRGYVIENGRIILTDSSQNLLNNEDVKKSYLGEK